ncbi:MAG TPA: HAD family hydrolase [Spirochaetales bacterium]|nr:HAD family hydrolase [Spirochaetales bacterium]
MAVKAPCLIVFDMDGVLIDVSGSYRDTVRRMAGLFFKEAIGRQELPRPLFDLADLAALKESGGLNNDWDLSFLVIKLLFSLVKGIKPGSSGENWQSYKETIKSCNVADLASFLKSNKRPLSMLLSRGAGRENSFVAGCYRGDVGSGNIIKQIFQELYLGRELFEATYKFKARVYKGEGSIARERLIPDIELIEELANSHILAVATGRPRQEADYALKRFKLKPYFQQVLTLDDCIEEEQRLYKAEGREVSLMKPDPFMLDVIAERVQEEVSSRYYIGDMPDDMRAAGLSQYPYKGIGLTASASEKEELEKKLRAAGAVRVITGLAELAGIL